MALRFENSMIPPALREYGRTAAGNMYTMTKDNGGMTLDLATLSPASHSEGFYVGGASNYAGQQIESVTTPIEGFTRAFCEFNLGYAYAEQLQRNAAGQGTGEPVNTLIGTWVNDGIVYVDIVNHITDRFDAITQGFIRNEKAIWDIANNKAIHTFDVIAV